MLCLNERGTLHITPLYLHIRIRQFLYLSSVSNSSLFRASNSSNVGVTSNLEVLYWSFDFSRRDYWYADIMDLLIKPLFILILLSGAHFPKDPFIIKLMTPGELCIICLLSLKLIKFLVFLKCFNIGSFCFEKISEFFEQSIEFNFTSSKLLSPIKCRLSSFSLNISSNFV